MNDENNNGESEVLRAKDILPPYNKVPGKQSPLSNPVSGPASGQESAQNNMIPKFNLAEQILAEQRKFTAQRRKRTVTSEQTTEAQQDGFYAGYVLSPQSERFSQEAKIIAEIVARDILKFCTSSKNVKFE